MPKGIGKALQDAIDGSHEGEVPKVTGVVFLNAQRRRIFEYLCLRPFSTSGRTASELKLSPSSVDWHLRALVASGYVAQSKESGLFYPKDFIDFSDARLFSIMHGPRRRDVLRMIIDSPGVSQVDAASALGVNRQMISKIITEFESIGLATKVTDGRFIRLYPTEFLKEKQDKQRTKSRTYVDTLIKRLEEEGQALQVLRRTETELQLRIGRGSERGILSIPLDPFGALIA